MSTRIEPFETATSRSRSRCAARSPAADARPHRNVRRGHVYASAFSSAASSTTTVSSAGSSVLAADPSSSAAAADSSSWRKRPTRPPP